MKKILFLLILFSLVGCYKPNKNNDREEAIERIVLEHQIMTEILLNQMESIGITREGDVEQMDSYHYKRWKEYQDYQNGVRVKTNWNIVYVRSSLLYDCLEVWFK